MHKHLEYTPMIEHINSMEPLSRCWQAQSAIESTSPESGITQRWHHPKVESLEPFSICWQAGRGEEVRSRQLLVLLAQDLLKKELDGPLVQGQCHLFIINPVQLAIVCSEVLVVLPVRL